jgi:hypothetical protein
MTTAQPFPQIKPTSRSYSAGTYPSTNFESLDGTKTHLRYGNKRVNATLTLGFSNISDQEAALIIENYEDVNATWDYVTFNAANGVSGVSNTTELKPPIAGQSDPTSSLQSLIKEGGLSLKWRYSGPPTVTSTFKGLSNVSCSFVACLDSP